MEKTGSESYILMIYFSQTGYLRYLVVNVLEIAQNDVATVQLQRANMS